MPEEKYENKQKKPVFVPRNPYSDNVKCPDGYMKNWQCNDDPLSEHNVDYKRHNTRMTRLPIEKTDEDVERMWEYNRMMGRM